MRKSLQAILVLPSLLLLAGCGGATTPQTEQQTVAARRDTPPAPSAGPAQQQIADHVRAPEPNETMPPAVPAQENTGTVVGIKDSSIEKAGSEAQAQEPAAAQEAVTNKQEQVDVNTPVTPSAPASTKPPEPNHIGAAQPDHVTPLPAEPNETARPADPAPGLARFYEEYAALLKTYVREDGWADYATLNRHRLDLKSLLTQIDELDPNAYKQWPRQEKLAFWVNVYNLKMLEITTRNYPIQSSRWLRLTWPPSDIRHIRGIWTDYKFIVMDEEFTLSAVEQQFFDKTLGDPRVYLAITYATRSGPPLRRGPYRGAGLDRQLDEQVRRFLSSPQGLQIDRRNMVVRLSAIFKPSWHGKQFLARYATDKKFKNRDPETRAVLSFLTNYLSREDIDFLEVENYTIEYINFDWRLNDASGS